ncbi:MAG: hypothetical protein KDB54_12440 [Solirubrobacterales bacterium]|nr:hypothetical protein [Solirubrobacterales bacterium]
MALAGMAALLFAMPTGAMAGKSKNKGNVKGNVNVLSARQADVVKSGKLKVRVLLKMSRKAPKKLRKKPIKVTLRGTSSVVWSPKSNTSLYAKTVKVRPNHKTVVTMKLNSTGKSKSGDCGAPTFKVTADYRSGKKKKRAKTSRKLSAQKSLCDVPADVDLTNADKCDFIAGSGNACLAPFPNDFYTKEDSSSETGKRLDLDPESTPTNSHDKHIDVTVLNQSDGFSPGPLLSVHIPGMDNEAAFTQSGIVSIKAMSGAFEPSQPVVLIDAATGDRQLIWAELDSNATSDESRNLIIRPGKNLQNGHRYIVALRNLKDADGNPIEAPAAFRLYRDTDRTGNPVIEDRRAHFESIFNDLAAAGIGRSSLYLAWDFTVASTENLTGRMLSIRDRAFAGLGDTDLTDGVVQGDAPNFTITDVQNFPTATGNGVEDARIVKGTFTVPCYLNQAGCPSGSTFDLDADQKPIRTPGNTMEARFSCNIPRSAINTNSEDPDMNTWDVDHTVRPSLYGHGLFGSINEVTSKNIRQLGTENGVLVCGTDWIGMSDGDVYPTAIQALADLSKFPTIPDRLQQGFLNFLFLGRLLIHPDGLASSDAFKFGGHSVINTDDLFYYGNSQGGIAGGALTAVATDFTRSVLYVPGMNYSTLLTRSTDFSDYALILYPNYSVELERPSMFALMQTMWDRGEPNGYANNMTSNPLPNTPAHKVMIEMAYGDHQVANVATEVEARTIGAPLRVGAGGLDSGVVDSDRHPDGLIEPFYGHDTLGDLAGDAKNGNAFFVWDIGAQRDEGGVLYGTDPAPLTNTPPTTGESNTPLGTTSGIDPHDTVIRSSPVIRQQIADFIKTDGVVTNPCGIDPCYAAGWHGWP